MLATVPIYGQFCRPHQPPSPVPLPTALPLFASALAGLFGFKLEEGGWRPRRLSSGAVAAIGGTAGMGVMPATGRRKDVRSRLARETAFLARAECELKRLGAEARSAGQPMLTYLLDLARREAEDELRATGSRGEEG